MHWVNDLDETLRNIRTALKPDGLFLMSMFGGTTLHELRTSLVSASLEVNGGVSPFTSPMIDGAGCSAMLMQGGFALPSIDMDRHLVHYHSPFHLMEHLQEMGESGALLHTTRASKDVLLAAAAIYESQYGTNGVIPATYEIFNIIGWSPGPNQAQPLQRGSGMLPLNAISTSEQKELNSVLEEYAKDPNNEQLQSQASELLNQLQEKAPLQSPRDGDPPSQ
jgi:NADH dehydrogenase [ubiquinone] 1 alpha subcomplex assembly factor 5